MVAVVVLVRWLVGLLVRSGIAAIAAVVVHTVQTGEGGAQQRRRVEG